MRDLRNELNINLPRCKGAYLEDSPPEVFTDGDWVLEPKLDGNRCSLQIGAKRSLLVGRNRQDFLKGVDQAWNDACTEFSLEPGPAPGPEDYEESEEEE